MAVPEWTNGLSSQNWMGKDIYGQDDKWFMDNAGAQQDITGLYNNYQGYNIIDNGLAAGMMVQGKQDNMVQGWDGNFYANDMPEFRRYHSAGYDGYDFRDAEGTQYLFNANGSDITGFKDWHKLEDKKYGDLAAQIFGPNGEIVKGNKDDLYTKYGLIVGGLQRNADFVRDPNYVPEDGQYSSMYTSKSNPEFSVRDYQLSSDPNMIFANAKMYYDASHTAGFNPILSGTDPILIDKGEDGYETWGRFSKYIKPTIGRKGETSYWNYYGGEADTVDQWNANGVPDHVTLGKSAGDHFRQYGQDKLNSDIKNSVWLKDDRLGTGYAFSEDKKTDYGYAPTTGSMDLKKTPAYKEYIGPILTMLSFIPGVNVVAAPLAAAYNVGMGIKNGNWAQAVGGVLGMPGLGQFVGGVAGSTIGSTAAGGLSQMANISPALANAIISGGLGAINGGWEGALAGGLGSYAGSYVGSSIGDATQNYDLGMTAGGLTNSMLNQLINTGQLNEQQLMTQGLTGALNAYLKSA